MIEIKNRVKQMQLVKWQDFKFVQKSSFKEFGKDEKQRLKNSILENGIVAPFYAWQNPDTNEIYCIDGYHRILIYEELKSEGVAIPDLLLAILIDCPNGTNDFAEVAFLPLIYNSNYASVTAEGMTEYMQTYDLSWEYLKDFVSIADMSEKRLEQKLDIYNTNSLGDTEETEQELEELQNSNKPIIIKNGDLFKLGNSYLICGDFQKNEIVETLFAIAAQENILITQEQSDPPYNLPANEFSNKGEVKHTDFAFGGGEMSDLQFKDFIKVKMQTAIRYTCDGALHYIWIDFRHVWHFTQAANEVYEDMAKTKRHAYEPKQLLVWEKGNPGNGSFYRAAHELCFIFKNGTAKHISHLELGDRYRTNVLHYPTSSSYSNPDRNILKEHPTPKPLQMIADLILDTTNEGNGVIDFFGGSGTTLIACEQTKRHCFMTEIEAKYCQVIIRRYLNYCKKKGIEVEFEHLNGELVVGDFE